MSSFEGFDDSSAARCANDVSDTNESNGSLEEQKNIVNDTESDTTKSSCLTTTSTSTDKKNISSDEKIQQQNDKVLHEPQDDDEARAFRSQFDEIRCVSRMLEYSKNNNVHNRFQGPAGRVPPAPLQRRITETSFHQRSQSHSTHPQQSGRHMLKHQRSISSIQGLSFNGNNGNNGNKFYSTGLSSTPSTPYFTYGFDNNDDILSPLRHPLHNFDDSSSVNGNDDALMKLRDLENCGGRFGYNNSRFTDEWDDSSSGYPSTPLSNGPYTPIPLTPSSTFSSLSPSTPYFAQNSLLDDDELFEKAKRLEEERIYLQIQQRHLDNAIAAHKLRYHHSDPSLSETEARYNLNNKTPPLIPSRGKTIPFPFGNKLNAPPPRFQNSQEPIGTPKKSGYVTPPTPPGSYNSSFSTSAPTFSLFSNPPALSLNQNIMSQQQKHHRTMSSDYKSSSPGGKFSPFNGYPLTPSNSPPKINNNDGYFSLSSYTNTSSANINIWVNNNENNYFKPLTPTILTPSSYSRAPLYSTPVDEREEDLFADECFNRKDCRNNFTDYPFAMDSHNWVN